MTGLHIFCDNFMTAIKWVELESVFCKKVMEYCTQSCPFDWILTKTRFYKLSHLWNISVEFSFINCYQFLLCKVVFFLMSGLTWLVILKNNNWWIKLINTENIWCFWQQDAHFLNEIYTYCNCHALLSRTSLTLWWGNVSHFNKWENKFFFLSMNIQTALQPVCLATDE